MVNLFSKSGAKMIQYSAIEIWSKIPPEIKNKTCLALFLAEYKKICTTQLLEPHFILLLHITQVVWFNSVSLLQWKVSNHEVFLLCILLGFCCVHRNWPHQTSVRNCEMHTKQTHIRSHEPINEFFSAKHDCVTVSQPT